jgi:hypothetical protein
LNFNIRVQINAGLGSGINKEPPFWINKFADGLIEALKCQGNITAKTLELSIRSEFRISFWFTIGIFEPGVTFPNFFGLISPMAVIKFESLQYWSKTFPFVEAPKP